MERDPVRLLDALLTACTIAAVPPLALAQTLQRLLRQLVDDHGADEQVFGAAETAAPPAWETDGAASVSTTCSPLKATPPPVAQRTMRRLPAKAAPRKGTTSGSRDWLALRQQVKAEQQRRGMDIAHLARAIGRELSTTQNAMTKRSPPSATIASLLRGFVAGPGATVSPGAPAAPAEPPAPPAAAVVLTNGTAVAGPDEAKALAVRLRAKRRPLPLTGTTLAATIGCTADELNDALHGRPVPPQAAQRLAAWAAG